ncbi:Sulfate/thiosulfate import ATP-binding protein cysA, putative [Theobroma cacao]|uniref:Sulfate/thiosulfate import ATP-binding protein cysA, putative n=1 Tax=Theobroma cacao TaxID=3641 RepID=A0A061DNZ2_THECC|nr:Sulfate/thiosulfate import ATP-binding protein cysA, putative [Theobroma cacao]
MAAFVRRIKRVTDPLDDRVKARLVGVSYVSSGSEHSAAAAEDDSPCLSELVHSFLEDDKDAAEQTGYNSDPDRVDSNLDTTVSIEIIIKSSAFDNADSYRNLLMAHVLKAMEMLSFFKTDTSIFRRKIMAYLREIGHNAAICKTKWSSSGGLTAGNYEFIDVLQSVSSTWQNRYFIDLDFASEFEIARPTSEYSRLLQYLPRVFVGKNEELKKIVKVMSDSAKRSLKSKELSLPPWRKNRYMQNKWFGSYRRTTNQISACASSLTPAKIHPVNVVKCRYVGFDDAVNGRLFVRTR